MKYKPKHNLIMCRKAPPRLCVSASLRQKTISVLRGIENVAVRSFDILYFSTFVPFAYFVVRITGYNNKYGIRENAKQDNGTIAQ